mgnify:CR=1 FL=1
MTKHTILNNLNRLNAKNTFEELLRMGAIPIVNENDTISTYEIEFGDNDTLSAVVSAMVGADLLILLSDIDGLFTDDPHKNPEATFIDVVEELDEHLLSMGKGSTGSNVGTGGMATKLTAAEIASAAGTDMIIANGADFMSSIRSYRDALMEPYSCPIRKMIFTFWIFWNGYCKRRTETWIKKELTVSTNLPERQKHRN